MSGGATLQLSRPVLLALVGLVLGATLAFLLVLGDGVQPTPDGAISLSLGENLSEGRGITTPVGFVYHGFSPHEMASFGERLPSQGFPPLYAVFVAVGELAGAEGRTTAGVLNLVGAVGGLLLVGLATSIMSRGSAITVGLVGAWTMSQTDLLLVARLVQPEAFFFLLIMGQALLVWWFVRTGRTKALVWCIVATASAVLFRQLGLALVGSGALAIVLLRSTSMRRRMTEGAAFIGCSLLPLLIYWPLSSASGSSAGFTQFSVHPPERADYTLFVDTVRRWLVDGNGIADSALWFGLLAMSTLIVGLVGWLGPVPTSVASSRSAGVTTKAADADAVRLAVVLALTVIAYLVVLWLASAFLDDDIEFGGRYLIPVQPLVFALIGAGIARFVRAREGRHPALGLGVAAVGILALVPHLAVLAQDGLGAPVVDIGSTAAAALEDLPADALVFAEYPEAVYLATGRGAYILPSRIDRYTGEANAELESEIAELADLAREQPVYVLYPNRSLREYIVPVDQLGGAVTLTPVSRTPVETLYKVEVIP